MSRKLCFQTDIFDEPPSIGPKLLCNHFHLFDHQKSEADYIISQSV